MKIYEELNGYSGKLTSKKDIYEILASAKEGYFTDGLKRYKQSSGIIKFNKTKEHSWALLSQEESVWVKKMETNYGAVL